MEEKASNKNVVDVLLKFSNILRFHSDFGIARIQFAALSRSPKVIKISVIASGQIITGYPDANASTLYILLNRD